MCSAPIRHILTTLPNVVNAPQMHKGQCPAIFQCWSNSPSEVLLSLGSTGSSCGTSPTGDKKEIKLASIPSPGKRFLSPHGDQTCQNKVIIGGKPQTLHFPMLADFTPTPWPSSAHRRHRLAPDGKECINPERQQKGNHAYICTTIRRPPGGYIRDGSSNRHRHGRIPSCSNAMITLYPLQHSFHRRLLLFNIIALMASGIALSSG